MQFEQLQFCLYSTVGSGKRRYGVGLSGCLARSLSRQPSMSWGEDPTRLARVSRAFRIYYLYAGKCLHPVGYAREIHFVKSIVSCFSLSDAAMKSYTIRGTSDVHFSKRANTFGRAIRFIISCK